MDFLNKAFAQFNDLFRSMSPGGRITAGLLLVVAVVSVGYLFQSQVSGGDDYLFGGAAIPTPTLQKMEEAFGKAGLNGFTIEGGRVKVPRSQRAAYLAALADAKALPPNFGEEFKDDAGSGLFEPPALRLERLKHTKEREISLVLNCMQGIERATVQIDSQSQSGLGQEVIRTASVFASAVGSVPLDDDQVDKMRYYVAGAIAGMKPENVTIADANGRIHPGDEIKSGGPDSDAYAKAVRRAERDLETKIRESLSSYIQNLTVTATVVLDHEKSSHTIENKLDPKPVTVRSEEDSRTMTRESSAPGGAPGLGSQGGGVNQPMSLASAGGKSGNENSEESKNKQVNMVSSTSTEKESDGRAIKAAKVAIGIPASYYEKVWQRDNPTKPGEEPKKPDQTALDEIRKEITKNVTAHVATLLPPSPDVKDPTTMVTVTTFQDIKPPEIPGPAVPLRIGTWLVDNWPMLAMVCLVLVSVAMLRSVLRGVPAAAQDNSSISARIPASESKSEEKEEPVEVAAARRLRRMTGTGPSLRDELSELVKEDPDSAAGILRTWIGQVN
jgi:flagellar M-ring protein FliF